jgi:hypothetical protein
MWLVYFIKLVVSKITLVSSVKNVSSIIVDIVGFNDPLTLILPYALKQ